MSQRSSKSSCSASHESRAVSPTSTDSEGGGGRRRTAVARGSRSTSIAATALLERAGIRIAGVCSRRKRPPREGPCVRTVAIGPAEGRHRRVLGSRFERVRQAGIVTVSGTTISRKTSAPPRCSRRSLWRHALEALERQLLIRKPGKQPGVADVPRRQRGLLRAHRAIRIARPTFSAAQGGDELRADREGAGPQGIPLSVKGRASVKRRHDLAPVLRSLPRRGEGAHGRGG